MTKPIRKDALDNYLVAWSEYYDTERMTISSYREFCRMATLYDWLTEHEKNLAREVMSQYRWKSRSKRNACK